MELTNVEFFYTYYVGHSPEDERKRIWSEEMIAHYLDSGMKFFLPDIYERCVKDEALTPQNIPYDLWEKGNLLKPGQFYLHKELTILGKPPVMNPLTGQVIEYPHFREMKEFYTIDHILNFAQQMLRRNPEIDSGHSDKKIVLHLLDRYRNLKKIDPLDMVLYLISYHKGEQISMIELQNGEEEVLQTLYRYQEKLRAMNKYRIIWRGSLNDVPVH